MQAAAAESPAAAPTPETPADEKAFIDLFVHLHAPTHTMYVSDDHVGLA